ncbi:MAG: type II toxin-antitoxin system VapC family toxin [Pirellulales bacterium]
MNILLDTHVLLWAAGQPDRLSAAARRMLCDGRNTLYFSVVSLWEIAIKRTLGRRDFQVDARQLRRGLLEHGYSELPLTGPQAVSIDRLPDLHKDPFDRMLIAQAEAEGFVLLTADKELEGYGGPVRLV